MVTEFGVLHCCRNWKI